MRRSYIRNAVKAAPADYEPTEADIEFLAADTNTDSETAARLAHEAKEA